MDAPLYAHDIRDYYEYFVLHFLVFKGKLNAEWLNSLALAVGGFYCTNNGFVRCTGCTYEIEVKVLLARLKPHQKPFIFFAQLFCELSYPGDHAIDCCSSVHLQRKAVELSHFFNNFAEPGVAATRKLPKLPIEMAIAATSNENVFKYCVLHDMLLYMRKIGEFMAIVEALEYEFFRAIFNQQLPYKLRVQDITAPKLLVIKHYDDKVKSNASDAWGTLVFNCNTLKIHVDINKAVLYRTHLKF